VPLFPRGLAGCPAIVVLQLLAVPVWIPSWGFAVKALIQIVLQGIHLSYVCVALANEGREILDLLIPFKEKVVFLHLEILAWGFRITLE
jgi:hypothetical protein